jgi:hypothetical protein
VDSACAVDLAARKPVSSPAAILKAQWLWHNDPRVVPVIDSSRQEFLADSDERRAAIHWPSYRHAGH